MTKEKKTPVEKMDVPDISELQNGEIPLFERIKISDLEEDGFKFLCDAAAYGSLPLVKLLITQGVKVLKLCEDCSAMCHAVRNGKGTVCRFLLEQADVKAAKFCDLGRYADNEHSMFDVVQHCDVETFKAFIAHGASAMVRDKNGNTLLHASARFNKPDIAQYLLEEHKFPVDCENKKGETSLYVGSEHGSFEVIKVLLSHRADVKKRIRSCENSTALHIASLAGHLDVAVLLVEAGADVNAEDDLGETPLHDAMCVANEYEFPKHGNPALIRFLCGKGARLEGSRRCRRCPFEEAEPTIVRELVGYLLREIGKLQVVQT